MGQFTPDYAGNFVDGPSGNTPITSTVMNNIEVNEAAEDVRNPASEAALDMAALYGHDVRAWAPNTPYIAGQAVVSPTTGDVVTAKTNHTSSTTYSGTGTSGNWNAATGAQSSRGRALSSFDVADVASAGLEFYEDFTTYPDGAMPATTRDGRPWSLAIGSSTTPGATPVIESGAMTFPDATYGGVYAIINMPNDVVRAGCEFEFTSHTAVGGEMAMAIMNEDIGQSYANGTGIPQAAMHLQIRPMSWTYDVNSVQNTAVDHVSGDNYNGAGTDELVPGTRYYVDVILDKPNNTAYIRLPQGVTYTATDPMIGAPGHKYIFWEPYRSGTASDNSQTKPRFFRVWADSKQRLAVAERGAGGEKLPRSTFLATRSGANVVMSSTATTIRGLTATLPAPPSMMFDVDITAPIVSTTTGGQLRLGIMNEAQTTWTDYLIVSTNSVIVDGTFRASFRMTFTGKAVGQLCTISAGSQLAAPAVASIIVGGNAGPTMRITPVPLV